ncbi:MAG: aspartate carbamoyltransferase regulatory subunit [Clostridia bacterium]|nr:aspartate carbamoyltransferase regulatory subunit [Clostridia bacterium]
MNIDSIKNGYVIDHIKAGKGMEIYNLLRLDLLDCPVAIIKNASSSKMGKKDIIKIDALIELNMDILGYVSPDATVDVIKDEKLAEKKKMSLPEKLTDVIFCKNPRCITTTEQELPHIFHLTDRDECEYRCAYCESRGK